MHKKSEYEDMDAGIGMLSLSVGMGWFFGSVSVGLITAGVLLLFYHIWDRVMKQSDPPKKGADDDS